MSGDVDLDIDLGDIEKPWKKIRLRNARLWWGMCVFIFMYWADNHFYRSVQAKVLKPVKEFLGKNETAKQIDLF